MNIARLERELRRIELLAEAKITRLLVHVRRVVFKSLDRGSIPNVRAAIPDDIFKELRTAMMVADLVGRRRSQLELARAPRISADLFSDTIKILGQQLKVDIDALQRQYDTQALRVMNDVSWEVETELRKTVQRTIRENLSGPDAIKALKQKFDALGVSPRNKYTVENIVRTQTSLAYNAGRWNTDQDPVIRSIIWGYTYVSVGDDRVRPAHQALDGVTLPKDDPFWRRFWPPNGWSCRCQVIPLFHPEPEVRPPLDVQPDRGFDFNPGVLFNAAA